MARALQRVDALCGDCPLSRFWWVARAATESLATDGMVITPARKALLAQYDRQLKKLVYDGERALAQEAPLLLIKESLFLASLGSGATPAAAEVRRVFGVGGRITDADLQRELALMTGSRGSVIRSVAGALKDEINQIKDTLDLAAQGVADTDYGAVAGGLRRVASTLEMVGKEQEATALRERAGAIADWPADTEVDSADFHALVDDLLAAENTVASLERSLAPSDDVRRDATNANISLYQLDDARMTVVGSAAPAWRWPNGPWPASWKPVGPDAHHQSAGHLRHHLRRAHVPGVGAGLPGDRRLPPAHRGEAAQRRRTANPAGHGNPCRRSHGH